MRRVNLTVPDKAYNHIGSRGQFLRSNPGRVSESAFEDELSDALFSAGFDQEQWYYGTREALHAIHIFWKGLEEKTQDTGGAKEGTVLPIPQPPMPSAEM